MSKPLSVSVSRSTESPSAPASRRRARGAPPRAVALIEPLERRALLTVLSFAIDPAQSRLDLSGDVAGNPFAPQPGLANSLSTTYRGTVVADVTPTSITFPGGSDITADNSGDWRPSEPEVGPVTGATIPPDAQRTDPANYGVAVVGGVAALREAAFDATLAETRPVAADGSFDSAGIVARSIRGFIDYVIPGLDAARTGADGGNASNVATAGRLVIDEGTATLTVPVDATFLLDTFNPGDTRVRFTGQLVATAELPDSSVTARQVFYNKSFYDGTTGQVPDGPDDDAAVAPDKFALLPGTTAQYENYTSYSRGLNGLMVDLSELWEPGEVGADDFLFRVGATGDVSAYTPAPAPLEVNVRANEAPGGLDRVEFVWADNAIQNQWLQVTVLANNDTGLAAPDVFYYGNLIGDTGSNTNPGLGQVNSLDLQNVRNAQFQPASITDTVDHNRSGGNVNSLDLQITRNNQFKNLQLITPPAGAAAPAAAAAPVPAPAVRGEEEEEEEEEDDED